ncbi:tetratricopeptide repeat-containing sulfotransferase family protein [Sphingomonas hylomeconis]|uniref:Sulfotransferase n=1 Tax=Sphingomonas hylomeconis TaxID=1395958 RepID=A0ABV7T0V7_9SPHN|nr:sulfotransferase [Sphingomonas hylomeconis]
MTIDVPTLGAARLRRGLARVAALRAQDPRAALAELHRIQDTGGTGLDLARLEAALLLDLGCGTFAAAVAGRAGAQHGRSIKLELLQLRGHMAAFARKQAIPLVTALAARTDLDRAARHEIARAAHELGMFEIARTGYAVLLVDDPDDAAVHVNLGHIHQKSGEMAEAEVCFRRALAINPVSGHGIRLLAYVRRQHDAREIAALVAQALPALAPDGEQAAAAHFALGKALEDVRDYAGAFEQFASGCAIMRGLMPYAHDASARAFALTADFFRDRAVPAAQQGGAPAPLFIVGLPRTGSTLLDRMLGCHADVRSMGELGNFKEAMKVATGYAGGPGFHEHFYAQQGRPVDVAAIGHLYRTTAAPDDFAGAWFTDKYHMNFLDLGLIAEALPEARFIHTVRDPLDTVLANYKQMFSLGFHHFSYDLEEAAHYYLSYRALMDHWQQRLPGRIMTVAYRELVSAPEATMRGVLSFLGLEWDPACLAPERNTAPVDTASLAQVRQPIYTSALDHAARYGDALAPARAVLAAAGLVGGSEG